MNNLTDQTQEDPNFEEQNSIVHDDYSTNEKSSEIKLKVGKLELEDKDLEKDEKEEKTSPDKEKSVEEAFKSGAIQPDLEDKNEKKQPCCSRKTTVCIMIIAVVFLICCVTGIAVFFISQDQGKHYRGRGTDTRVHIKFQAEDTSKRCDAQCQLEKLSKKTEDKNSLNESKFNGQDYLEDQNGVKSAETPLTEVKFFDNLELMARVASANAQENLYNHKNEYLKFGKAPTDYKPTAKRTFKKWKALYPKDKRWYQGEFDSQDQPDGRGVQVFKSGDVTVAHWKKGGLHGKVTIFSTNNDVTVGQFKDGLQAGIWVSTLPDNSKITIDYGNL